VFVHRIGYDFIQEKTFPRSGENELSLRNGECPPEFLFCNSPAGRVSRFPNGGFGFCLFEIFAHFLYSIEGDKMGKKTLWGEVILALFFFNLSSALPALITVTSPNTTDTWIKGSVATISWTYSRFANPSSQKVIIRLRQGSRVVCNIADDIPLTA
jgi:hypothetical protein